ncbi:diaminopropionate ammonia-lyase [Acetobacterium bakii]|uniref:Diaminopropionate ammonia-lyase n=1 Tax=Acetobacterium bakii TaxID=52689 RepID=A0A0L6TYY8_9FIRM|nr:diaminopropionate ammonia-lyase [Acetobacterium bakii]KNZ41297.1 diaminopropionate ammonia-lyase [Acetobacterium bakii]
MESQIKIIPGKSFSHALTPDLSPDAVQAVLAFHQSLPMYEQTPLIALPCLAQKLGIGGVFVKDESRRFGLNAFKALGAVYAMAKIIAGLIDADGEQLNFADLTADAVRHQTRELVFITATDGNHGKAVAWAASIFGCQAIVYMPQGSRACRAEAIRAVNHTPVEITDLNYDDTVRLAWETAQKNGYQLIQDTGFAGYEDVPNHITQGYTTMVWEALSQLSDFGKKKPSHVFLQAGVGSMAGGVLGYLSHYYPHDPPVTVIVEPSTVACIYQSVAIGNGQPQAIDGNPVTIMAGLNCGEPNPLTWPILRDFAAFYASCPDRITELGMQTLGKPLGTDTKIISGESGAVGLGLLMALCEDENLAALKQELQLDQFSTVLLFSTEGDTDPEGYAAIVEKPE